MTWKLPHCLTNNAGSEQVLILQYSPTARVVIDQGDESSEVMSAPLKGRREVMERGKVGKREGGGSDLLALGHVLEAAAEKSRGSVEDSGDLMECRLIPKRFYL